MPQDTDNPMGTIGVEVRFFAGARAAAGVSRTVSEATTVGELRDDLIARYGTELKRVLSISSLLVDGRAISINDSPGSQPLGVGPVDVLPPFAGG
jgi:molybdopterin synthase sulfur carrier subunit